MQNLSDSLLISQINMAGTHDSGADYGCQFAFSRYAKCQDWSIAEQLTKGIRFLDIRCRPMPDGFDIHHGMCYQRQNFDDVLTACQQFLEKNPSECILMRLKSEHKTHKKAKSFADIFKNYEQKYQNLRWYQKKEMPLLSQVRGKIVLLDDANLQKGIRFTNAKHQDDYYVTSVEKKWTAIQEHLERAKNDTQTHFLYLNSASGTGLNAEFSTLTKAFFRKVYTPQNIAQKIMPRLEAYFAAIKTQNKAQYGVLIMDFPTEKVIQLIIEKNF
ncbi:MAG: phosphatidylinositol-specific phospholipase C [Polaribacter sp.]